MFDGTPWRPSVAELSAQTHRPLPAPPPPEPSPGLAVLDAALHQCIRSETATLPAEIDTMPPGLMLAIVLASVEDQPLSGEDRVTVLGAHQRLVSHFQAKVHADIAALTDTYLADDPGCDGDLGLASEATSAEVSAALQWTRRAADAAVDRAYQLTVGVPEVGRALDQGRIDLARARVLVDGTIHLPRDEAREIIDQIIDDASQLTTGQLGSRLRRLCMAARPDDAADRYRTRLADRHVVIEEGDDGTAQLLALNLPADRATAAARRIDHLARLLTADGRTLDQKRADVLLDLVLGIGHHNESGGVVDLHVDLTTLAQLNDHPGELGGYGPVIADIARQIAQRQHRSEWRWTLTHPHTGRVIDVGTTRRRPTPHQRRLVETRHPTCIFPGCRVPSRRCDLDHTTPWAQSHHTRTDELAPLCRHHHVIRHRLNWTYQASHDGTITWTSGLGHTHTRRAPP